MYVEQREAWTEADSASFACVDAHVHGKIEGWWGGVARSAAEGRQCAWRRHSRYRLNACNNIRDKLLATASWPTSGLHALCCRATLVTDTLFDSAVVGRGSTPMFKACCLPLALWGPPCPPEADKRMSSAK